MTFYEQGQELIKKIQPYFNEVIRYAAQFPQNFNIHSDEILKSWYDHKMYYINLFGGSPIYEVGDCSFTLSDEARLEKIITFRKQVRNSNYELALFIQSFQEEFYETQQTDTDYYFEKDGEEIKIPKGTKIIKAFKYFCSDQKQLNLFQSQASRLIQEDKISGTLCLSVHPLDYLSSSENTYNWRSCHSLDGDYCAGNLSYMCDYTTVVCYIRGKDHKQLPHFGEVEWNTKKWRMLFFVSDDNNVYFAGRHYPFFCKEAMDRVKTEFWNLLDTIQQISDWHDDTIELYEYKEKESSGVTRVADFVNPMWPIGNALVNPEVMIQDQSELHYNDLLKSTVYDPYYCWNTYNNVYPDRTYFKVGSKVICPFCGKEYLNSSSALCCDSCYNTAKKSQSLGEYCGECHCCGTDVYDANAGGSYIDDNGEEIYICLNCFEGQTHECDICHRYYDYDYLVEADENRYICGHCLSALNTREINNIRLERIEQNG